MSDYFEAYKARITRNDKLLHKYAEKLKSLGYKVYRGNSDGFLKWIRVRKADDPTKETFFGFAEVPYRWYRNCSVRGPFNYDHESQEPFTIEDLVRGIAKPVDSRFEHYLKEL